MLVRRIKILVVCSLLGFFPCVFMGMELPDQSRAKIAAMVHILEQEKMLGLRVTPAVDLPRELLCRSKKILPKLQYAATLLDYQRRAMELAVQIERDARQRGEWQKRRQDASITVAENADLAHLIEQHNARIISANREITDIEVSVCDHYDKMQWLALKGCLYPLFLLLKVDDEQADVYDLHDERWHEHVKHLFLKTTREIDGIVMHDQSLQRYRFHAWDPEKLLAPSTSLSTEVDCLMQNIGESAPPSPVTHVHASESCAKKKSRDRYRPAPVSLLFSCEREANLAVCGSNFVSQEDLDFEAAFCKQYAVPPSSGPDAVLVRKTPPCTSPQSPVSPVRDDLCYDERVLVWHGPDDSVLHEHVQRLYPTMSYENCVALHRIPFVLENQFVALGQTQVQTRHDTEYRVLIFCGALIDATGCIYVGWYEISRPINRLDYVVHRFFRSDKSCPFPTGLVLPTCGENERNMAAYGSHYTIYENEGAITITEDGSWSKVTYILFKSGVTQHIKSSP